MTSLTRPTTRASGHIKLKFQLEIAQLLLPAARPDPGPNCSHAPQQIACASCTSACATHSSSCQMRSGCVAMRCHVNWQHLRRNLSLRSGLLTPSIWTQPKRPNVPHCHAVAASGLPDAWLVPGRGPVPGARCYH